MTVKSICEAEKDGFSLINISSIHQTPTWNMLVSREDGPGRRLNGFLLITEGECRYTWSIHDELLTQGSLIYLPTGSHHRVTVEKRPFSYYRISFDMAEAATAERIVFCDTPWLVSHGVGRELVGLSEELMRVTVSSDGSFTAISILASFLERVKALTVKDAYGRVSNAVRYIDGNFSENTDMEELARMCCLCESHFYRIFKAETGMTPVEYRNRLRVKRAQMLLGDPELPIYEIATALGFDSTSYFDRVYKRYTGEAPNKRRSAK